jgi:hypothetical protein
VPILQLAESILVVEVCDWGAEDSVLHRVKDVSRFLIQHRVANVTERVLLQAAIAGDVLIRFAQEVQADLIVAGAYGHSRLGEWMIWRRHPRPSNKKPNLLPIFTLKVKVGPGALSEILDDCNRSHICVPALF